MRAELSLLGRSLGSAIGAAIAGYGGAVIGNFAGGFLVKIIPDPDDVLTGILKGLATDTLAESGKLLVKRLKPDEAKHINHDLQSAFRDAFRQAVVDTGGERCFPKAWKERPREKPSKLVFLLTPEGNRLWSQNSPLATQVVECFQSLLSDLESQALLPIEPSPDLPAADIQTYLDASRPHALTDLFFTQVVSPRLAKFKLLFSELPELERHLRAHLLDRTLFHFNEYLKERTPAWRAFNRLMLEGLRGQVRSLESGHTEILERLDLLLSQQDGSSLAEWSDGIATLLHTTGEIEKSIDENFDTLTTRVIAQHGEILVRIDRLTVVAGRIETKVDRVLRFLEGGQYVIEGAPPVSPNEPPAPGEAPFQGLLHFDVQDAGRFFGREVLTARLVSLISQHPFLAVVGGSGSGKSSLVRAGLIPALLAEAPLADGSVPPTGSSRWTVHILTPGAHPLESLSASLTRAAESVSATETLAQDLRSSPRALVLAARKLLDQQGQKRMLLVIDQFEELFTACKDPQERQLFIDQLMGAASQGKDGPLVLVLVLRADFYAQCGGYETLRAALEGHQVYIGPMNYDELRFAIERPALQGNWVFEPGLVDLILQDIGSEPGALPLLSHALLETWRNRRGRIMTLESYAESGGVRRAVAQSAERVYSQLTEGQQTIARRIFLRLTEPGEGVPDTRRRAMLSELVTSRVDESATVEVLHTLADARLLTLGKESAEVAHEALIREWPRLQSWLDEDREGMRVHRHITEAAREWQHLGRDPGELYRGARLANALEWANAHPHELNELELEFLETSQAILLAAEAEREAARQKELEQARQLADEQQMRAEAEQLRAEEEQKRAEAERMRAEEQTRTSSRLRQRAMYLVGALAVALVAAIFALSFWNQANRTASENASLADERATAVANAEAAITQAVRNEATAQAASALARDNQFAAEEARAAAEVERNAAEAARMEAEQQAEIALNRGLVAQAQSARDSSPDLALLLSVEAQRLNPSQETYSNLLNVVGYNQASTKFLHGHTREVKLLAINQETGLLASVGNDGSLLLWDLDSGELLNIWLSEEIRGLSAIAFSPDGAVLAAATYDYSIILFSTLDLQPILDTALQHSEWIDNLAFSPDESLLAASDYDNQVVLWDVGSGERRAVYPVQITGNYNISKIAFTPDGQRLAAVYQAEANRTQLISLWELASPGAAPHTISVSMWSAAGFAISPDGSKAALIDYYSRLEMIDLGSGEQLWSAEVGADGWDKELVFNPNGNYLTLAVASIEGERIVRYINASDGSLRDESSYPLVAGIGTLAVSEHGHVVAWGYSSGKIELWEPYYPDHPMVEYLSYEETSFWESDHIDFNPARNLFAYADDDGYVVLLYMDGQEYRSEVYADEETEWVSGVAISPDGNTLAVAYNRTLASGALDSYVKIFRIRGLQLEPTEYSFTGYEEEIINLEFDHAGMRLAISSYGGGYQDKTVAIWDITSGETHLLEYGSDVIFTEFSPDDRWLVADTPTLELWDMQTYTPTLSLGELFPDANLAAFSPDGRLLAIASYDYTIQLWDLENRRPAGQPMVGHTNQITSLAFSPNGDVLASGSYDDSIHLWDTASGRPIGGALSGYSSSPYFLRFNPEGDMLYSVDDGGTFMRWDLEARRWEYLACRVSNRSLTEEEWQTYLGEKEYHLTCPDATPALPVALQLNREGWMHLRNGADEDALADFDRALKLDPGLGSAHYGRGEVYYRSNDHDQAIQEYLHALEERQGLNSARISESLGWSYYRKGRYDQALAAFEGALSAQPDLYTALEGRSWVNYYRKDYQAVITDVERMLEIRPGWNATSRYQQLSKAYFQSGDTLQGEAVLAKYIQQYSDTATGYAQAGWTYYQLSDYENAIQYFSRAVELNPQYAGAYDGLGWCYYYLDDYDQAILQFDVALTLNPRNSDALDGRGEAYFYNENYKQAIADLTRLIEQDPDYAYEWYYDIIADAYYFTGDKQQAETYYARVLAEYEDPAEGFSEVGWSYYYMDAYEEAIEYFQRAIESDPLHADGYDGLGWSYYYQEQYEQALTNFDLALKLSPDLLDALDGRSRLYYALEQYESAVPDLLAVMELSESYVRAWRLVYLAKSYYHLGDTEKMQETLERIVSISASPEEGYVEVAGVYDDLDEDEKALQAYQQALESNAGYAPAYNALGWFYYYQDQVEQSLQAFSQAIQLDPQDGENFDDRGYVYYYEDNYREAAADLQRAVELGVSRTNTIDRLAEATYELGDKEGAQLYFSRLIEQEGYTFEGYNRVGWSYYHLDDYPRAIEYFELALGVQENPDSCDGLGWSYYRQNQHELALAYFDRALALQPDNDDALDGRARTHFYLENYAQAVEDIEALIKMDADYARAWRYNDLGEAYYRLGDLEGAQASFARAIELDTSPEAGYENVGWSYYNLEEYQQAVEYFTRSAQANPQYEDAWEGLGESYYMLGDKARAEQSFAEIIELYANIAEGYSYVGWDYNYLGDYPKAIEYFTLGIQADPAYAENYDGLGSTYYDMRDYTLAIQYLEKAIQVDPGYGYSTNYDWLGWSYYHLGSYARAQEYFQLAVEGRSGYADAYLGLGDTTYARGQLQQALVSYLGYLELVSGEPRADVAVRVAELQAQFPDTTLPPTFTPSVPTTPQAQLDQAQEATGYGYWFERGVMRWQEFVPGADRLTAVEINIGVNGEPGGVVLEIREGAAWIAARTVIPYADLPPSGWLTWNLPAPLRVAPGEAYRLFVYSDADSASPENRYFWRGSFESRYCASCSNSIIESIEDRAYDFAFRTYGYGSADN